MTLTRTASASAQALALELDITDPAKKAKVFDLILALLTLERERDGWQPIGEAPKDGTRVLLWVVHSNAKYSPDPIREGWAAAHEAYWTDFNTGGWVWHGLCGAPTHWQPLPSPPGAS